MTRVQSRGTGTIRHVQVPPVSANDNLVGALLKPPARAGSPANRRLAAALPEDALAIIERPPARVNQSGRARDKGWRLRFARRGRYEVDPLTGWTGSADTLSQIEMNFPSAEAAVRYANRHGLRYELREAGSC